MADASTFDLALPGVARDRVAASGAWVDGSYAWLLGGPDEIGELISAAYMTATLATDTVNLADGDDLQIQCNGASIVSVTFDATRAWTLEEIMYRVNDAMAADYATRRDPIITATLYAQMHNLPEPEFTEIVKPYAHCIAIGVMGTYYVYVLTTRYGASATMTIAGTAASKIGFTDPALVITTGYGGHGPGDYTEISPSEDIDLTGASTLALTLHTDRLDAPPAGYGWRIDLLVDNVVVTSRWITGTSVDTRTMTMTANVKGTIGTKAVAIRLKMVAL